MSEVDRQIVVGITLEEEEATNRWRVAKGRVEVVDGIASVEVVVGIASVEVECRMS